MGVSNIPSCGICKNQPDPKVTLSTDLGHNLCSVALNELCGCFSKKQIVKQLADFAPPIVLNYERNLSTYFELLV